jgi:hypothetical protein
MNNFVQKVFDWLLLSSADPSKVAVTVKGFLTMVAAAFIPLLGLTHINLGNDTVNTVIDGVSLVIQDVMVAVGAAGTLFGVVRKAWLTVTGKNQVINTPPTH